MKYFNYSLHNFLSVRVCTHASFSKNYFDNIYIQLENFLAQETSIPDLSIHIGPFVPDIDNAQIFDDKYWIKNNSIYFKSERKFSKWALEVKIDKGRVDCKIDTNLFGAVTKPHFFAEFFIQYLLLEKGVSVIHAAALEKGSNVLIIPGSSGGGKTTICMSLVEDGYTFLGDNYVIIFDGMAYSYTSPLNIFSYNLVPVIRKNLKASQLLDLYARFLLYKLTGGYIKIFKKINPVNILNNVGEKGSIKKIAFLTPNNNDAIAIREIDKNIALKRLNNNMKLEWYDNFNMMDSALYGNCNFFYNYWTNSYKVLEKNLVDYTDYHEILVPEKYSPSCRAEVSALLNDIMK